MTSFAVQTLVPLAPLGSKEKGSMGNRLDCAGAQMKNKLVTGLQAGAVIGAGVGADYLVRHSDKTVKLGKDALTATKDASKEFIKVVKESKVGEVIKNGVIKLKSNETVQNTIEKINNSSVIAKAKKLTNKASEYIKNNSIVNKTLSSFKNITKKFFEGAKNLGPRKIVGIAAGALLACVLGNGIYKSGQIDQKYTDKAKFQQPFNN